MHLRLFSWRNIYKLSLIRVLIIFNDVEKTLCSRKKRSFDFDNIDVLALIASTHPCKTSGLEKDPPQISEGIGFAPTASIYLNIDVFLSMFIVHLYF